MADRAPPPYRRPFRRKIRQGDIALAEFHQLKSPSGSERKGPSGQSIAAPDLPYFGPAIDYEIEVERAGTTEKRILRVWQGFVMVTHQACEIDFANENDSRLTVAPIASRELWPEAPWEALKDNRVPGFFYLPPLEAGGVDGFDQDWPESLVALSSSTASSNGLIRGRRVLSLETDRLVDLQDAIARFYSVRGFAGVSELEQVKGKRIARIVETGRTIPGPSTLIKVVLGDNAKEVDDADDEVTVTYWGVRPGVSRHGDSGKATSVR